MGPDASYLERVKSVVSKLGWVVQAVFPDVRSGAPGYAYTIGLHDRGERELVVFGLPVEIAHQLLNDVARDCLDRRSQGDAVSEGGYEHDRWSGPMFLLNIQPECAQRYARLACDRSEGNARYRQLVWADLRGRFPWDVGFDERFKNEQPLLRRESPDLLL